MITWIQNNLQTHLKVLFVLLLLVVIVSFVFTIGNIPGFGVSDRSVKRRDFYGYDLNSQVEMRELFAAAALSLEIDTGSAPRSELHAQEAALRRAALEGLADQLQIPEPDERQLKSFIRYKKAFRDPSKQDFSHERYTQFIERLKADSPQSAALLPFVFKQDFRIQKVSALLSGPGYVLPFEAEKQEEIEDTLWTVEVGTLDLESFEPTIEPGTHTLQTYYTSNAVQYEEPEKVAVTYAFFPASDFVDLVTVPSESELQDYFEKNKIQYQNPPPTAHSDSFDPARPQDRNDAPPPDITLKDVRAEVTRAVMVQKANRRALQAADDFVYRLFDRNIKKGSEPFHKALAAAGIKLQTLPHYSRNQLPSSSEPPIPQALLRRAFELNQQRYYTDPHPTNAGAVVLFLKERVAPRQIPFQEARERVIADFYKQEKQRLFSEHGRKLHSQLNQALQEGRSFQEAAAAHSLKVDSYSDFTLHTAPVSLDRILLSELLNIRHGRLSKMVALSGRGHFLYVAKREAPTVDPESITVQQVLKRQQALTSNMTERFMIAELITRGLEFASQSED